MSWWPPKAAVTDSPRTVMEAKGCSDIFDTEKELGMAPVACKWEVPFHCCTVPLDCLLMLSTWGSKDLKSLNSNQREIRNPPKDSSVPIALGSVSAALGFVSVHIPRGYDISPQCLPWAATECAQCSVLNKSCQKRSFHQQGSLRSIYL